MALAGWAGTTSRAAPSRSAPPAPTRRRLMDVDMASSLLVEVIGGVRPIGGGADRLVEQQRAGLPDEPAREVQRLERGPGRVGQAGPPEEARVVAEQR